MRGKPTEPAERADFVDRAGPTARRRMLGLRLLALREALGWSAEKAGSVAGVSQATVSRYERNKQNVKWNQVEALCRAYGASDGEREFLVGLAKNSQITDAWWVPYAGKLPSEMRLLLGLEQDVPRISQYSVVVIPGLLQTMDYARSIRLTPENVLPPPEVDEYLKMRMRRQHIFDRADPPHYHVVLDEAVIRRAVGGSAVMAAQLDHVIRRSREPNITVQVLPFSAGAYTAALNSFIVYGGLDPALDVVYVESQVGSLFLEEANALEEYARSMDFLRREALDPDASVELIAEASRTHLL